MVLADTGAAVLGADLLPSFLVSVSTAISVFVFPGGGGYPVHFNICFSHMRHTSDDIT